MAMLAGAMAIGVWRCPVPSYLADHLDQTHNQWTYVGDVIGGPLDHSPAHPIGPCLFFFSSFILFCHYCLLCLLFVRVVLCVFGG